jgi:AcrR family transcriptional regulator
MPCQAPPHVEKGAMTITLMPLASSRRDAADAMRAKLLDAAARILASDGISGLTARRLSAAAGASTKVVYNHFGGMPGVVSALYERGFSMLAAALSEAVKDATLNERIAAIAKAYRAFARTNADLFDLMYGPSVTMLLPTSKTRASARLALDVLIAAFTSRDALDGEDRARAFWAAMHGVVALERTGWFNDEEAARRLIDVIAQFQGG